MKLAIMQPYLFPYIGYFQLINAVNAFVFFDDVNFIKKGWINRNNLLLDGKAHLFTLAIAKVSQNKKINEILISQDHNNKKKLLELFKHSYSKAPEFKKVFPLIEDIFSNEERNLSRFLETALKKVCRYLDISPVFIRSSEVNTQSALKGQDRIISICGKLEATEYVNTIGGRDLYDKTVFKENAIELYFLRSEEIVYRQFKNAYVPNLSIVDVLMFNPIENVKGYLNKCVLT